MPVEAPVSAQTSTSALMPSTAALPSPPEAIDDWSFARLEQLMIEERAGPALREAAVRKAEEVATARNKADKQPTEMVATAAAAKKAAIADRDFETKAATSKTASASAQKKSLKFKDAVGRNFCFPWHLCNTWMGIEDLVKQAFLNVEILWPHVAEGHYDLLGPTGDIILPQVWETVVEPYWTITMHMWPIPEPTHLENMPPVDEAIMVPDAPPPGQGKKKKKLSGGFSSWMMGPKPKPKPKQAKSRSEPKPKSLEIEDTSVGMNAINHHKPPNADTRKLKELSRLDTDIRRKSTLRPSMSDSAKDNESQKDMLTLDRDSQPNMDDVDTSTRPRLTQEQVTELEKGFSKLPNPNTEFKKNLAERIGLTLARVNNWYQNRRAKSKNELKMTEAQFEVRPTEPLNLWAAPDRAPSTLAQRSKVEPQKQRGRPTKAEVEARITEAALQGEGYQHPEPKRTGKLSMLDSALETNKQLDLSTLGMDIKVGSVLPSSVPNDLEYELFLIDPELCSFHDSNTIIIPRTQTTGEKYLRPKRIASIENGRQIIAATGTTGAVKGTILGGAYYIKMDLSGSYQELWPVKLERESVTGDCGSWVVDAETGGVYGHIVAGDPVSGLTYIVPAYKVFDDIESRFGTQPVLPQQPALLGIGSDFENDQSSTSVTQISKKLPTFSVASEPVLREYGVQDHPREKAPAEGQLEKARPSISSERHLEQQSIQRPTIDIDTQGRGSPDASSDSSSTSRLSTPPPRPHVGPKAKFTLEDDALLIELKEKHDMTWKRISEFFPGRSSGMLQVRYCTKLKVKGGMQRAQQQRTQRSSKDQETNAEAGAKLLKTDIQAVAEFQSPVNDLSHDAQNVSEQSLQSVVEGVYPEDSLAPSCDVATEIETTVSETDMSKVSGSTAKGSDYSNFQCPFNMLFCQQSFSNETEWRSHSLGHFNAWNHSIGPPKRIDCCYCNVTFESEDTLRCWTDRMKHIKAHHRLGYRMIDAKPDFGLFKYLHDSHLIDAEKYKELVCGNKKLRTDVVGIVDILYRTCIQTAKLLSKFQEARPTNDDLYKQVTALHEVLDAVQVVLTERMFHFSTKPASSNDLAILEAFYETLIRCSSTVAYLRLKAELFVALKQSTILQRAVLHSTLENQDAEISRMEANIDADITSLQSLLTDISSATQDPSQYSAIRWLPDEILDPRDLLARIRPVERQAALGFETLARGLTRGGNLVGRKMSDKHAHDSQYSNNPRSNPSSVATSDVKSIPSTIRSSTNLTTATEESTLVRGQPKVTGNLLVGGQPKPARIGSQPKPTGNLLVGGRPKPAEIGGQHKPIVNMLIRGQPKPAGMGDQPKATEKLLAGGQPKPTGNLPVVGQPKPAGNLLVGGEPKSAEISSNRIESPEELEARFKVPQDHWSFFVPGGVFEVLLWEPVGERPLSGNQSTRVQKHGDEAFAKVCEYVIVRARPKQGYSVCLLISTYGGQGTAAKLADQSEHAIVYTGEKAPSRLPKEKKLTKDPIQVIPVNGQQLHETARVNCAKTYPVEHNVKVSELGMVTDHDIRLLVAYWQIETENYFPKSRRSDPKSSRSENSTKRPRDIGRKRRA